MNTIICRMPTMIVACVIFVFASQSGLADDCEIVSNATNVIYASMTPSQVAKSPTIADRILSSSTSSHAFVLGAHNVDTTISHHVGTNRCLGVWTGKTNAGMVIRQIIVNDEFVELEVEERFLVFAKNVIFYGESFSGYNYFAVSASDETIDIKQECRPPLPWSAQGVYSPYCRASMTNRIEHVQTRALPGLKGRTVIGYYDADGDGYATMTRLALVSSPGGDYLDESYDGPYWVLNDVLVVKYKVSRQSWNNFIYGTEDGAYHYWEAVKSLYQIKLETTTLRPWWQMPEYQ